MDLSAVILAMAEAQGPSSVLGAVVGALTQHEHVALARVWFLDDQDCPVCKADRRDAAARALHLRASRSPSRGPLQFDVTPAAAPEVNVIEGGRGYHTDAEWRRMERDNLVAALEAAGGKVAGRNGAAELLGVNANTLTSRLRALGLKKKYS